MQCQTATETQVKREKPETLGQTGRRRVRTGQRKTVWEEGKVSAGERKTLHWICGGAKLPSGAT